MKKKNLLEIKALRILHTDSALWDKSKQVTEPVYRICDNKKMVMRKREWVYSQGATSWTLPHLCLGQSEAEIFITERVSLSISLATELTTATKTLWVKPKEYWRFFYLVETISEFCAPVSKHHKKSDALCALTENRFNTLPR